MFTTGRPYASGAKVLTRGRTAIAGEIVVRFLAAEFYIRRYAAHCARPMMLRADFRANTAHIVK